MSTPPRFSERKSPRAPEKASEQEDAPVSRTGKQQPLSRRLPDMSDYQLTAYQSSAHRIAGDAEHPKHASAKRAIPLIEAEIRRRAEALRTARKDATP